MSVLEPELDKRALADCQVLVPDVVKGVFHLADSLPDWIFSRQKNLQVSVYSPNSVFRRISSPMCLNKHNCLDMSNCFFKMRNEVLWKTQAVLRHGRHLEVPLSFPQA